MDFFDFNQTVKRVQAFSGWIDNANFDADLGSMFGDQLRGNAAVLVSVNGGNLIGHKLLMLARDAAYQAGSDYVVDTGTLSVGNFV